MSEPQTSHPVGEFAVGGATGFELSGGDQPGEAPLADDAFRHRHAGRIGADESTLPERAVLDPAATVASDAERLRSARAVSARVTVSGHVYDVATGLVQTP